MELLNIRTRKSLCKRPWLRVDRDKLKSRMGAAETAIFNRLQAISRSSDHAAERQAIVDALALIRVLKRDALDFPEWEKKQSRANWSSKLRALPRSTDTCSDFETSAETPAERASCSGNTSLYSLNIISGVAGINLFRTWAASMPFITGIERSKTIKSGRNLSAFSIASWPFSQKRGFNLAGDENCLASAEPQTSRSGTVFSR